MKKKLASLRVEDALIVTGSEVQQSCTCSGTGGW